MNILDLFLGILGTIGAIGLAVVFTYLIIKTKNLNEKIAVCQIELTNFRATYLRILKYDIQYKDMELLSFDGGQNWYAVDYTKTGAVIIKDPIEQVYPGLKERFTGLHMLIKYVQSNGPITLQGERTSSDLALLKEAGVQL